MRQYLLLIILLTLWIGKFIVWNIPNNRLNEMGLGGLVGFEEFITFFVGGLMAVFVYKSRLNYNNQVLYWSSQILSIGLFVLPLSFIVLAFIGVMFFGLSV